MKGHIERRSNKMIYARAVNTIANDQLHLTMSNIFRTLGGSGTKTVQYYYISPK